MNEITDDEFRKLIGASPDKPLAPILTQLKPYIEGSAMLTPMQQGAVFSQSQQIIAERRLMQGHVPSHDTVRQHLRQFAAGLQFSYELGPWPESKEKPLTFEIPPNPSLMIGAYVGMPKERDKLVLGVTPFGLANHGVMKHYSQIWLERFENEEKSFHADADSFRTGMEEGRHIAQELIPELKEKTGAMPHASQATGPSHADDLGEKEVKELIHSNYTAMIERSERISRIPLPPLPISRERK